MNSSGTQNHPDLDHRSSDTLGFMPWMPAARRSRRAEGSVALAPPPETITELPLSLTTIDSAEEFEAISIAASDLISNGRSCQIPDRPPRHRPAGGPLRQWQLHRRWRGPGVRALPLHVRACGTRHR